MLLVLDNYDSFTYNLVQCLWTLGCDVEVVENDRATVAELMALHPSGIIISPGPHAPAQAGVSLELIRAAAAVGLPLLGVCLGHQAIAEAFGGSVVRAGRLMHGKTSPIRHDGRGIFAGLPSPFPATRYHSLIVAPPLPACLEACAWSADQGELMGLRHRALPMFGVQFHPESYLSEHGPTLLHRFATLCHEPARPAAGPAVPLERPMHHASGGGSERPRPGDARGPVSPSQERPLHVP
jgi:anthranilate synthase component 2